MRGQTQLPFRALASASASASRMMRCLLASEKNKDLKIVNSAGIRSDCLSSVGPGPGVGWVGLNRYQNHENQQRYRKSRFKIMSLPRRDDPFRAPSLQCPVSFISHITKEVPRIFSYFVYKNKAFFDLESG